MWRAASLYHMFSTVRLGSVRRFKKFVHVTCFMPRIALYVRTIHISFANIPDGFADLIPSVPSVARNLHTLNIEHTGHTPVLTRLLEHAMFSTIQSLALTHVWFGSFAHLQELICIFPNVQNLRIGNVTWDLGPEHPPDNDLATAVAPVHSLCRLRHLYLLFNGNFLPFIVRWMLHTPMLSQLTSLSLYLDSVAVVLCYNELLAAVGPQLVQLNLEMGAIFYNGPLATEVIRDLSLASCTQLTSLHFVPSPSGRPPSCAWMVSALRTLPGTAVRRTLRELRLHFSLWDAAHWALIIELGQLDAEVAAQRYAALRTLMFCVRAEPRFRIHDFVRGKFPLLRGRGPDIIVQQVW